MMGERKGCVRVVLCGHVGVGVCACVLLMHCKQMVMRNGCQWS